MSSMSNCERISKDVHVVCHQRLASWVHDYSSVHCHPSYIGFQVDLGPTSPRAHLHRQNSLELRLRQHGLSRECTAFLGCEGAET